MLLIRIKGEVALDLLNIGTRRSKLGVDIADGSSCPKFSQRLIRKFERRSGSFLKNSRLSSRLLHMLLEALTSFDCVL